MAAGQWLLLLAVSVVMGMPCLAVATARTPEFSHKVKATGKGREEEGGFLLQSSGSLVDVLDLDKLTGTKVAVGTDGRLRVTLTGSLDDASDLWRPGRLVVASGVRRLSKDGDVSVQPLFARIKEVEVMDDSHLRVAVEPARGMDAIASGDIIMQYSPPAPPSTHAQSGHRSKRYVTNILSEALSAIDWRYNDTGETINLNCDQNGQRATKVVLVSKAKGQGQPEVTVVARDGDQGTVAAKEAAADVFFKFSSNFELQRLHTALDLKIERNVKIPVIHRFISQMTVNDVIAGDFEAHFRQAGGVEGRYLVARTPRSVLRRLPLGKAGSLPPFDLEVAYSSATYLDLNATASGPLQYKGDYRVTGNYALAAIHSNDTLADTQLATSAWNVTSSSMTGQSDTSFSIIMTFYHEVQIETSVRWAHQDVDILLLPTMTTSMKPTIGISTEETDFSQCVRGRLVVDGNFKVNKTAFEAEAFHKAVWELPLQGGLSTTRRLVNLDLLTRCQAKCPHTDPAPTSDITCGQPVSPIHREDPGFDNLTVVAGSLVQFAGEEASSATWCGKPGTKCRNCERDEACADRVMSPTAARLLTRLAHLARVEWQTRLLRVEEAWDEPDSQHPQGSHGPQSLHYDGRALSLSLLQLGAGNSSSTVSNMADLKRLRELALCAGFPHAEIKAALLELCVPPTVHSPHPSRRRRSVRKSLVVDENVAKEDFELLLQDIGPSTVTKPTSGAPVTSTEPTGTTAKQVVGPPLPDGFQWEPLYQYVFDDVIFAPEGAAGQTCLEETRACHVTCNVELKSESWAWCQTRALTPRMALRLRRLAALAGRPMDPNIVVSKSGLNSKANIMERMGRSVLVTLKSGSDLKGDELFVLARAAGFDHVERVSPTTVRVHVRMQEGFRARLFPFHSSGLLAVSVPSPDFALDLSQPQGSGRARSSEDFPLFDGFDISVPLTEHYRIGHVAHPAHRFFRASPLLLDCLELSAHYLGAPPVLAPGQAYSPEPEERKRREGRHPEEQQGPHQGTAAYIQPPSVVGEVLSLERLGGSLLAMCAPILVKQGRKLGLGCHGDRLYVDVRYRSLDNPDDTYADIWDDGNPKCYHELVYIESQIRLGGPIIMPQNIDRTCKDVLPLSAYFTFSIGFFCMKFSSKFCDSTLHERTAVAGNLTSALQKALGSGISGSELQSLVDRCLLSPCGGCAGAGDEWRAKVAGCTALVMRYAGMAHQPFGETRDVAAFYNSHTANSSLHSLACHDGSTCLDNTQLFALAQPPLQARYRPDSKRSQEELLFSAHDNPSPLLEVIQQQMAFTVEGKVKVYIEKDADIGVLKDTIKVLMVYNRGVREVEFHYKNERLLKKGATQLQRHLDNWALRTCPRVSRFAAAPFTSHEISKDRHRRSAERSQDRNRVKQAIRDWEIEWVLRN